MLSTPLLSTVFLAPAALALTLGARQTGTIPGHHIHFGNSNSTLCLAVDVPLGASFENGSPVVSTTCNFLSTQEWWINEGSTKVQLLGSNFCLDAGSTPGNGVPLKIWECFDNLPAQAWFLTGDNRIALENQGQCVDLPSGNTNPGTQVQTWQCTDGDTNQVWAVANP